jgi:hypothetical protein
VAPARPYWKGYLKLALVSCPIAVYPGCWLFFAIGGPGSTYFGYLAIS